MPMRIEMLDDHAIYVDGVTPQAWEAGQVYDCPDELAEALVRDKIAKRAPAPPPMPDKRG